MNKRSIVHSRQGIRSQRGFTLMEMLVTLVLFTAISSLVWQALGTLTRLETRLADSRLFVSEEALRSEWVRQALRGLMNGAQSDPLRLTGRADTLRGYTSMPPWPRSSGPEGMELLLRSEEGGDILLLARRPDSSQEWPLWSWPGPGEFAYLDRGGHWHPQWPPPLGDQPGLPMAIRLLGPPGGMILVALPTGNNPMLRRADLEGE